MLWNPNLSVTAAAMTVAMQAAPAFAQPALVPVPIPAGEDNTFGPITTNRDGCSVACWGGVHAFTWSIGHDVQDISTNLDPVLQGLTYFYPAAISDDGSVIVGHASPFGPTSQGFRWNRNTGVMSDLGDMGNTSPVIAVRAVSGDGSIIVGFIDGDTDIQTGFRWTVETGMQPIPELTDTTCITRDGSVIVGWLNDGAPYRHAIRISSAGAENIGDFTPAAISDDGDTIVGYFYGPVRWTRAGGLQPLPIATSDLQDSGVSSVTADGSLSAGNFSWSPSGPFLACLWGPSGSAIDLNVYLPSIGMDLGGWTLDACAISKDGSVLIARGIRNDQHQGFYIRLHQACGGADYDHDGDVGTDADIEAFFACLAGNCCPGCYGTDLNGDGDVGTDTDIVAFFAALAGAC
jgi:probable HAF family extracellular repeat protein